MKLATGNSGQNLLPYSSEYGYSCKTNKNVSFKGFNPLNALTPQRLDTIGRLGANPTTSNLVSTAGFIVIRPPITMMDKETPKEDRKFSAIWQLGIALGGLAVQLAYNDKFARFSNFLAQKLLGVKLNEKELNLANTRAGLVEAIDKDRKLARRIVNNSLDDAQTLANTFDETPTVGKILRSLDPRNLFKKHTELKPFRNSPALVVQLKEEYIDDTVEAGKKIVQETGRMGKKAIDELIDPKSTAKAKKILQVSGASKIIHFSILLLSLNAATMLVTKYIKPTTNFLSDKLNMKFLKTKKTDEKQEEKKKWNNFDKGIIAAISGLTLLEGVNFTGHLLTKKRLGDIAVGKIAKGLNKALHLDKAFDYILKKPSEFALKHKDLLASQANVNDKWVERNVIANLFLRLAITVPTIFSKPKKSDKTETVQNGDKKPKYKINKSALYNTVRLVNDEVMNLTLLTAADKALVKPVSRALARVKGVPAYNEGIKVIADQGIKNILLVCTVMGFLNNILSNKMMKLFDKCGSGENKEKCGENEEQNYQEYRRQFVPSQNLANQQHSPDKLDFSKANKLIKTMDLAMLN